MKANYKTAGQTLYGFENVKWYMNNIEEADITDCIITEDGAFWFKHINPENGEIIVSDAPDYIHSEDKDYSCLLSEWIEEMAKWNVLWVGCGQCETANEAYKLVRG